MTPGNIVSTFPAVIFCSWLLYFSAAAEDIPSQHYLGYTFSVGSILGRDASALSVSLDYDHEFQEQGFYGSGFSSSLEYDREYDQGIDQVTESINFYAGVFYLLNEKSDLSISIGQSLRERTADGGSWGRGESTAISSGVGYDINEYLSNHSVAATLNYELDASEWAIGFEISGSWGL